MKSLRLSAFQQLRTASQTDRWSVQILCFCASLGFSSVLLETINLRIGFYWFWILAILCWKVSGRWARQFVEAGDTDSSDDSLIIALEEKKENHFRWLSLSASFFIWCLVVYHLIFYFYELNGNWVIRNGNLNGDWPYHMNMIQYLAKLNHFWPENPVFYDDHMRYSFGVNWLTALFVRGGIPLTMVITISSIVLVTLLMVELYKWFGVVGILAFFMSGGGWGVPFVQQLHLWEPGIPMAWKNLFLAVFVPQRGMWVALPTGVFLVRHLFLHLKTTEGLPRRQKKIWAFLWAMLPFFHLHTFFAISALIFGLWLVKAAVPMAKDLFLTHKRILLIPFFIVAYIHWPTATILGSIYLLGWAFKMPPPFFYYLLRRIYIPIFFLVHSVGAGNLKSSVRFVSDWMANDLKLTIWQSWLVNFGPWLSLPLVLVAFHKKIFAKVPHLKEPFFVTLGMFVLFSHLMLAPWAWDQIKILLWLYLVLSAIIVLVFESHMARIGVALMMAAVLAPGIVQFSGGHAATQRPITLWSTQDRDTISSLLVSVPSYERMITAPDPHHPIFSLGQPIVAGYTGHLWSHGLDVGLLEESVKAFVLGQPVPSRWKSLSARYLLFGPQEKRWLGVEELPTESKWVKINSIGDRSLYFREASKD